MNHALQGCGLEFWAGLLGRSNTFAVLDRRWLKCVDAGDAGLDPGQQDRYGAAVASNVENVPAYERFEREQPVVVVTHLLAD